jgi:hypothetical protein
MLVYQVVRAFGDAVKFRGVSVPDEYSELANLGDVALRYRDHCWKYDVRQIAEEAPSTFGTQRLPITSP